MNKSSNLKLAQLLTILNDGEFHDGTALGEKLQVTRSAVWKMIRKLERYGVSLQSIKGKGYAMTHPLILLDKEKIMQGLTNQQVEISVFESIDSTNAYLKTRRADKGVQVCIAEHQTVGRGRFQRAWVSPFAQNVTLSCLYTFHKDLSELAGLSLVVSLAVFSTLQFFQVADLQVKWPNDLISDAKKIAGNLIEVQAESNGLCQVVIGIGINVNMLPETVHDNIGQPWTSMRAVRDEYFDRNNVCTVLINHLLAYLQKFANEGFDSFVHEWDKAAGMQHKRIAIKTQTATVVGEVMGINAQGHLILKMDNGAVQTFSSGDTTIVKS